MREHILGRRNPEDFRHQDTFDLARKYIYIQTRPFSTLVVPDNRLGLCGKVSRLEPLLGGSHLLGLGQPGHGIFLKAPEDDSDMQPGLRTSYVTEESKQGPSSEPGTKHVEQQEICHYSTTVFTKPLSHCWL